MIRGLALLLSSLALLATGCGDDASGTDRGSGDPDAEAVEVIRGWADDLRQGNLAEAADRFRIPSVVQNGTAPLDLDSKRDVLLFNASLPCGAELTGTEQSDEYVIATFELTERPGPGECGQGVGVEARTAFLIEDGLIVEWRRVADAPGSSGPPDGPVV